MPHQCPICGEKQMIWSTHYRNGDWLVCFRCGHQHTNRVKETPGTSPVNTF